MGNRIVANAPGLLPAPQVTVIIPCLNPAIPILQDTLRSVQDSTYQGYEIIIVDDGSTDKEFLRTIAKLEIADPRIRVIHHLENRGLSAARNTGVCHCDTPFFLLLDADDIVEPTFIEKCLWALESHENWAFCNGWVRGFGARHQLHSLGFERGREFLESNQITSATAVIRREADRAVGGHDETIRHGNEDWDYWLKMAAHGFWGGTVPEYLVRYRYNSNPTYWPDRDDPVRLAIFKREMRKRYPHLWKGGFPEVVDPLAPVDTARISENLPFTNQLPKRPGINRLLILVPWMTLGGADRFNLTMIENLTGHGFEITVCATADGPSPWLPEFLHYTKDVFILRHFLQPRDYPRFINYVISSRQIDMVLVSNSILGYSLLPYLRSRHPELAFVDFVHMVETDRMKGGYARVGLKSQPFLDLNIVGSHQIKKWMVEQGAEPSRIEVCHINVDTKRWDPTRYDRLALRRSWKVPDEVPVILYAARLGAQKRPRVLAEVMSRLSSQRRQFLCLVAGDGPERGWLERYVKKYRLGHCMRILGAVEPQRMPELMAVSDLFFLPSQDEGIALTLYEAMAMSLVPVGADVGGQQELVTPETGYLVPHGHDEIATYVKILCELLESPERRKAMGQAARERVVSHFNLEQVGIRMSGVLQKARDVSRSTPRTAVSRAEGLSKATLAISEIYHERLTERLWGHQRAEWGLGQDARPVPAWQRLAVEIKKHVLHPIYLWALAHGMRWLRPLKDEVYQMLGNFWENRIG